MSKMHEPIVGRVQVETTGNADGWDPYPVGDDVALFALRMRVLAACDATPTCNVMYPCLIHESRLPRGMIAALGPRIAATSLTSLVLNCAVDASTFDELVQAFPSICELYLENCQVDPGAWPELRRLQYLKLLWIETADVIDAQDQDDQLCAITVGDGETLARNKREIKIRPSRSGIQRTLPIPETCVDVFEFVKLYSTEHLGFCLRWKQYESPYP